MSGFRTKERLFHEAVRLFSKKGYHNISLRSITRITGFNESTAYYYYKSKADILDEILDTFEDRLNRYLPANKHIKSVGERDGPRKALSCLCWNYALEDDLFMQRAFRIVCMEQFTNEKAGALVRDKLHGEVTEKIRCALDELVERGEIPAFDTYSFSELWAQTMCSSAVLAVIETSSEASNNLRAANELMLDMAVSGKIPEGGGLFIHNPPPDAAVKAVGQNSNDR